MNFSDCIAARDPYCVWNNQTGLCERNYLSAQNDLMGDVPEWLVVLYLYMWLTLIQKDEGSTMTWVKFSLRG